MGSIVGGMSVEGIMPAVTSINEHLQDQHNSLINHKFADVLFHTCCRDNHKRKQIIT